MKNLRFTSQPLNVLGGVRVNVLKTLGELIVEPLHSGDKRARNGNLTKGCELLHRRGVLVGTILNVGGHNEVVICLQQFQELVELFVHTTEWKEKRSGKKS